ncbi:hypothetical protein JW964_19735 [candidate division KSB1 bacterium]|nr:hypothetical protein [candidate division KSB1 bacterium]
MKFKIYFMMIMILAILAGSLSAQKIPQVIFYQGYLTDNNGDPINQNQAMTFRIYTALTGGEKRWEEVNSSVPVNQGVFSILLGSQKPIPMDIFSDKTRFLEIVIGNETLSPRQQIASVPYAYTAGSVQGSTNVFPTQGNVGIGLDNPTAKLQVKGPIHSTEGGFKFPDGSTQTTAAKGSGTGGGTLDQAYDFGGPGAGRKIVADAGPVQIDGNGLEVEGSVVITGEREEGGQLTLVDGDNQGAWEIDNAGPSGKETIRFFRDGTQNRLIDAFTIKSNGNVGIGFGDPQYKLAVNGIGYFRGLRFPNSVEPNSVGLQGENYLSFGHAGVSADFIDYHNNTFYFVDSPGGENEPPNVNISGDVYLSGQVLVVGDDGLKLGASGVSILQIMQLTGLTATSGSYTKMSYPTGFNMDNTRIISWEMKLNDRYWISLGAFDDFYDGVSIHYCIGPTEIDIIHGNKRDYQNKPFRMLLMRIK